MFWWQALKPGATRLDDAASWISLGILIVTLVLGIAMPPVLHLSWWLTAAVVLALLTGVIAEGSYQKWYQADEERKRGAEQLEGTQTELTTAQTELTKAKDELTAERGKRQKAELALEQAAREHGDALERVQREHGDALQQAAREHGDALAGHHTQTMHERFGSASEQLGSDNFTVRRAGVHAMAQLADGWEAGRGDCIDMLCGYLRRPYAPDPGPAAPSSELLLFREEQQIRHGVIEVIAMHLREGAPVSWQGLALDFRGVVFDGGDFQGAVFSGSWVRFDNAVFADGIVDFRGARFSDGLVYFSNVEFRGGTVSFESAKFAAIYVDFADAKFSGALVDFSSAEFSGGMGFFDAEFSRGTVDFTAAWFFTRSQVGFNGARFSGAKVNFLGTDESSRRHSARFSGGKVTFAGVSYSPDLPTFPWTPTPPVGPWADDPPSGVTLPQEWQLKP